MGVQLMDGFRRFRDYFCYCGLTKEEYRSIKKEAYISNFGVWKYLYVLLTIIFAGLTITALVQHAPLATLVIRAIGLVYSVGVSILFYTVLKPDSIAAQLIIYLTMILLLICGLVLSLNQPDMMAVTFMVILVLIPMFMIDKPYFMAILLVCATVVFIFHSVSFKTPAAISGDIPNAIVFCLIGIVTNTFYNGFRVHEFALMHAIELQRDTDELTGLLSKRALVKAINTYIRTRHGAGALLIIDLDFFKAVNDNYGHDVGDSVLQQIGTFLRQNLRSEDIRGRFGGDEFIVFLPDQSTPDAAVSCAERLIAYANSRVALPDEEIHSGASVGIALLDEEDKDFSTLFKKADTALYSAKNSGRNRYCIFS